MKKIYFHIIAFLILPLGLAAQTAPQVLFFMPYDLCPTLTPQDRKQLMLIANSHLNDTVNTTQGGKVWVDSVSVDKNYMRLHIAEDVTFTIFVDDDSRIYLIRDYCAPLCSSVVTSYDAGWNDAYTIMPPDSLILPYAEFNNGTIEWREQYEND